MPDTPDPTDSSTGVSVGPAGVPDGRFYEWSTRPVASAVPEPVPPAGRVGLVGRLLDLLRRILRAIWRRSP